MVDFSERSHGPVGARSLSERLDDLNVEGVWAEVVFPTAGFWASSYQHREDHRELIAFGNDWMKAELLDRSERLVPTAQLPALSIEDAVTELERCADMGFGVVNLATTPAFDLPDYNDPAWEPVWQSAVAADVVIAFHIGTDPTDFTTGSVRTPVHHGAGEAMLNYTESSFTGQRAAMKLVASGVLDRHPKMRVLVAEGGAGWVPAVADRMTEGHYRLGSVVSPRLERSPREIFFSQVYCTFQHGWAALEAVSGSGYQNVIWGRDYPHPEGTWGHTQHMLATMATQCSPAVFDRVTVGAFAELFPQVGAPPAAAAPSS